MKKFTLILVLLCLGAFAGCHGLTAKDILDNAGKAIHDAQLDRAQNPAKYDLVGAIPGAGDIAKLGLALAVGIYAFVKRNGEVVAKTALRQTVSGVEAGGKTPELEAALDSHQDESTKALVASIRANLPDPAPVVVPAVVTK